MSKKMQKEMFKNCRDYLEGRKDRKEFWEVQIAHEEIVLDKQLPLFGGHNEKLQHREGLDNRSRPQGSSSNDLDGT